MNALIETAIGLALLYFLASLLVGAIVEYISAMFKMRARVLRDALTTMLGAESRKIVLEHALVEPTRPKRTNGTWLDKLSQLFQTGVLEPSYVHPRLLAQALVSSRAALPADSGAQKILIAIENLPGVLAARNHLDATQQELELWFDEAMKRWAGVYTRQSQAVSVLICVLLVPVLNIDTVAVTRLLWTSPETRMALAAQATQVVATQQPVTPSGMPTSAAATIKPIELAKQAIDDLRLPLGWSAGVTWAHIWSALLGWVISILAVSAGSRFWFGVLNRLTNIRLTGPPPGSPADTGM